MNGKRPEGYVKRAPTAAREGQRARPECDGVPEDSRGAGKGSSKQGAASGAGKKNAAEPNGSDAEAAGAGGAQTRELAKRNCAPRASGRTAPVDGRPAVTGTVQEGGQAGRGAQEAEPAARGPRDRISKQSVGRAQRRLDGVAARQGERCRGRPADGAECRCRKREKSAGSEKGANSGHEGRRDNQIN